MSLAVGHITYANCAPFFHHLPETGFDGRIVQGVPAQLNRLLAQGKIDVSPSSSFEYGRAWRDYLLLPDLSISSRGAVQSVLLFAPGTLESLDGQEIALTGESATSVHLLEVILREFVGVRQVRATVPETPVEELVAAGRPALLIGDRALRMALCAPPLHIYDLGKLWHRCTALPFVFALWILRRQIAEECPAAVRTLLAQLAESRRRAFASLESLAAQTPERTWMGEERLVDYWRCMSYHLPPDHLQGLALFYKLLVKYGKLEEEPQIRFFE